RQELARCVVRDRSMRKGSRSQRRWLGSRSNDRAIPGCGDSLDFVFVPTVALARVERRPTDRVKGLTRLFSSELTSPSFLPERRGRRAQRKKVSYAAGAARESRSRLVEESREEAACSAACRA